MIIKSQPGTFEAIAEVCSFHLGQELVEEHHYMLFPGSFLDVEQAHTVVKSEQQKAVATVEKSLRIALQAFYSLHPDVRQSVEGRVLDNIRIDAPATRLQPFFNYQGRDTPFNSNDNLELYLRAALSSVLGVPADTPNLELSQPTAKHSALSAAREAMSDLNMRNLTPQAKSSEAWQKALAVKQCRQLWAIAKDDHAPLSFSPSRPGSSGFAEFLTDMIEALGKQDDWPNTAGVVNAWRERALKKGPDQSNIVDEWFL